MYYVYVLKLNSDRLYYGYTSDLKRRITEHKRGKVKSTHKQSPVLIYYEAFTNKDEARAREVEIKKGKGREEIKRKLFNVLK